MYSQRHPPGPVPASGRNQTHTPAPRPPVRVITPMAYARLLGGISSAAMIASSTTALVENARRDRLGDRERGHTRRQRAGGGSEARAHDRRDQESPPAAAIGEDHHAERQQHAHPDRCEHSALVAGRGVELVGGEGDRLADQRAQVPGQQCKGAERGQDRRRAGVEAVRRHPDRKATALGVGLARCESTMVPLDARPNGWDEEPAPDRGRHRERGHLHDILGSVVTEGACQRALPVRERTFDHGVGAFALGDLEHQRVAAGAASRSAIAVGTVERQVTVGTGGGLLACRRRRGTGAAPGESRCGASPRYRAGSGRASRRRG